MNKQYFLLILFLGCTQYVNCQIIEMDTSKVWPDSYVTELLESNDSLSTLYKNVKETLSEEKLKKIFSECKEKYVNEVITKLNLAKELTSVLGPNVSWEFNDSIESIMEFETMEQFSEFIDHLTANRSFSYNEDGTIKRIETKFKSGKIEVIEKDKSGNYMKTIIDENGIENKEIVSDPNQH